MSDEKNNTKDDDGILSYIKLLSEITESDNESVNVDNDFDLQFIVRSSAEDVTEEAHNNILDKVSNSDEIPYDNPRSVLVESERQFAHMREPLLKKIEEIKRKEEESVSGADIDSMLYVIEKNAGKTGKFTLIGGAESLIYNTANKFGWNKYERELVYEANKIAGRKNHLHRHLLLDTVLIIPQIDVID